MADHFHHNASHLAWKGEIDTDTDTFKDAWFTSSLTSDKDDTAYSATNELTGGGYTAGGYTNAVTLTKVDASDRVKFDITDPTLTPSGGSLSPAYVRIYDDTHASNALIYTIDLGGAQTVNAGNTLTINIDATNGLFYIDQA
ncbi:MAG: hypothetical protein VXB01_02590 [Opitutae bacterium]